MKLVAPQDLYVPAVDAHVAQGETVEVDADIGASLLEQGWKRPSSKDAPKPKRGSPPEEPIAALPAEVVDTTEEEN